MSYRFIVALLLVSLVGCGSPGRTPFNPPSLQQINVATSVWGAPGTFTMCSGSHVVQTFVDTILPNGDMAQTNWTDPTKRQRDTYRVAGDIVIWVGSYSVDANGTVIGGQLNDGTFATTPLILVAGAAPSVQDGTGTFEWGNSVDANGNVIASVKGLGYRDVNTWTFDGVTITRHEEYYQEDMVTFEYVKYYDLTTTYRVDGIASVAGFGRCQ